MSARTARLGMASGPRLARRALTLRGGAHPTGGDVISFDSGYASPEVLPDFTHAAVSALNTHRSEALQYGPPLGLPELREWIAGYMRDDGANVSADNVLVVNGAKNGLDLLCRLLTEEGDAVVVTAPTYFTGIPILRSFGLEIVEVGQDAEGLDAGQLHEVLEHRAQSGQAIPKFVYDIPDFHNPTGITMSADRRRQLVDLAGTWGMAIVEDSPYRKLRYDGEQEPSLKSLDPSGIVYALGTFSKLLSPGLRLGWIAAPHDAVVRAARLKSDGGTSPLAQRMVLEFLAGGGLVKQIERARAVYSSHRDAMAAALRAAMPSAGFLVPKGGYYLWLRLPERIDASDLMNRAYEEGVSVIAGAAFFAGRSETAARYLRLAYSYASIDEIHRGVEILAHAYRARMQ